jgi:hypothetical protein
MTAAAAKLIVRAMQHGWTLDHTVLGAAVLHMRRRGQDYWLYLSFGGEWF